MKDRPGIQDFLPEMPAGAEALGWGQVWCVLKLARGVSVAGLGGATESIELA